MRHTFTRYFYKNLLPFWMLIGAVLFFLPHEKLPAQTGFLSVRLDPSQGALDVKLDPNDPATQAITKTTPNMIQDAFQDMKNYLGLNILKYQEQQSRLEAIIPPNSDQSKNNGALITYNKPFTDFWRALFTSNAFIRNLFQPSGSNQDSDLVFRHLSNYCSVEEMQRGVCWPSSTDSTGNYIGAADLTFNSIWAVKSYPNSVLPGVASALQTGAMDFINNLLNPKPIPLPNEAFDPSLTGSTKISGLPIGLKPAVNTRNQISWIRPTTSNGDNILSSLYRQAAMLSIPQQILINMVAERTQIPGLGKQLGFTDANKANMSPWEALEYEATRRYQSEAWHNGINSSPSTAVLREIANIAALQAAMQFRQIQQAEEIKALMAAQVASQVQMQAESATATQQQPQ